MRAFRTRAFALSWQRGVLLAFLGSLGPDDIVAGDKREGLRSLAMWALRQR